VWGKLRNTLPKLYREEAGSGVDPRKSLMEQPKLYLFLTVFSVFAVVKVFRSDGSDTFSFVTEPTLHRLPNSPLDPVSRVGALPNCTLPEARRQRATLLAEYGYNTTNEGMRQAFG
jgi:hypothetical protein